MDWALLLAGVPTGVTAVIEDVVPLGVVVLIALAGIGIALRVFRKFGVSR
jgi:hypothetical protein